MRDSDCAGNLSCGCQNCPVLPNEMDYQLFGDFDNCGSESKEICIEGKALVDTSHDWDIAPCHLCNSLRVVFQCNASVTQ